MGESDLASSIAYRLLITDTLGLTPVIVMQKQFCTYLLLEGIQTLNNLQVF